MNYQAILFDFDGVLCKGRFYEKTLLPDYREVYDWIQANIFGDKELFLKWMKGQTDSAKINKLIAENTGIEYGKLIKLYEESVRGIELEKEVTDLAELLKQSGQKVGIITDNVDIFSKIIVPNRRLETAFDIVINSADHGLLKKDEHGRLFDIALTALGEKIENSLMVDDSEPTIELYRHKGGQGFVYRDIKELKSFLRA